MTIPDRLKGPAPIVIAVIAAAVLRFGAALLYPSIFRPDEIYQNVEPAFRMVTGSGIVTWEWVHGIRSPVFPAFIAGTMRLALALGVPVTALLVWCWLVFAWLSALLLLAPGMALAARLEGPRGLVLAAMLLSLWPDLVYFGPKPLAEVQAGHLLFAALALVEQACLDDARSARVRTLLAAGGLLASLAFGLRFHLLPVIALLPLWAWVRRGAAGALAVSAGIVPGLALFALADWWAWGAPFASIWRNIALNLGAGVSDRFGVAPPPWYLVQLVVVAGALVVPLVLLAINGARRAPLMAAATLAVLAIHSAIAHKEYSFVYAALPPMVLLAALGMARLIALAEARAGPLPPLRLPGWTLPAGTVAALVLAAMCLAASAAGYRERFWQSQSGLLRAQAMAAADPALCGLGLRTPDADWDRLGGYTVMGRAVPLVRFDDPRRVRGRFNYAIGGVNVADGLPGFVVRWCDSAARPICLAQAPAQRACRVGPGETIEQMAARLPEAPPPPVVITPMR